MSPKLHQLLSLWYLIDLYRVFSICVHVQLPLILQFSLWICYSQKHVHLEKLLYGEIIARRQRFTTRYFKNRLIQWFFSFDFFFKELIKELFYWVIDIPIRYPSKIHTYFHHICASISGKSNPECIWSQLSTF